MSDCGFALRVLELSDGGDDEEALAHLDQCARCRALYEETVAVQPRAREPRRLLEDTWWDVGLVSAADDSRVLRAQGLFERATEPARQENTLRITPEEVRRLELWGIGSRVLLHRSEVLGLELRTKTIHDPAHQETDDFDCTCTLVFQGANGPLLTLELGSYYGYGDPVQPVRKACLEVARCLARPLTRVEEP